MTSRPALHHVNLKTTRLQEMIDWYGTVLGAEVVFQNDVAAWISNDDANHRIALLAFPGFEDDPGKAQHTGIHHMAFEHASFGDLMESYARLRDEGITPPACLDHGMTFSLYYRDPDQNRLELQCDLFGGWDASKAWMRTAPEFLANPIGVFFDPEAVLAAHESGVEVAEIHRRAYAGEYPPSSSPDLGVAEPA